MARASFPLLLPAGRPYDVVGLGGNAFDHLLTIPRHPQPGEKIRFTAYESQGGGRAATAMVVVTRLGHSARYLGGVGDDAEGERVLEDLRAEGVDVAGVRVRPGGLTQRAFIMVDEVSGERTIVWGRGEGMPLGVEEVDERIVTSGRLFFTDAQNPLAAIPAARIAAHAGMPVISDLEAIRPGLDALLPMVDFAIAGPGFPELATGSRDLSVSLRAIEERSGGALVIVTQGGGGAVARIDGRLERLPAYAVEAVDTTGAGDVFHGAFAVACLRGFELRDAIDFANAIAAMKCRRPGGRAGIPRSLEEVERFRNSTPHRT